MLNNQNFYNNKNVLVTGASGFVGINLVNNLIKLGANIFTTSHNDNFFKNHNQITNYKCDLENLEDCLKVCNNIDYIFMCAANASGALVMKNTPLVHLSPNVRMNINMLEAAYQMNIKKFLFISSNTVYPLTDFAVKEEDVTNEFFETYHIVAWMKRFTEIVCEMYSKKIKNPMTTIIVRPGNLYGPYDKYDWKKSKAVPAILRRAIEKHNPMEIWGDGSDVKDFLYIDDFINSLILAMEKLSNYSVINIGSGLPVTLKEVIHSILTVTDYTNANLIFDKSKPTMIPKRLIDISLAKERLGWYPQVSLDEGLKKTYDWYIDYYRNSSPEE